MVTSDSTFSLGKTKNKKILKYVSSKSHAGVSLDLCDLPMSVNLVRHTA